MFTIYRFLEANMFHDNTCLCCLGVEVLIFLCSICLSYFAFPSIILLLPGTAQGIAEIFSLSHFFFIPPLSETGNKHECRRSTLSFLVRSIKACPWMRRRPPFSIILRRGSISLSERQASFCRKSASFSRTSRLISM